MTPTEIKHIEVLCIDTGINARASRNEHLSALLGRKIRYLDEITDKERPKVERYLRGNSVGRIAHSGFGSELSMLHGFGSTAWREFCQDWDDGVYANGLSEAQY